MASHRQSRTYHPPADQCPLCPTTEANPTEIPERDYQVVGVREPLPLAGRPHSRTARPCRRLPAHHPEARGRSLRGGLFHQRSQRGILAVVAGSGASRRRRVGRPDERAQRHGRRRAGLSVRESRRRDRGDARRIRTGRFTPTRSSPLAPRRCSRRPQRSGNAPGENLFGALLDEARKAPERIIASNDLWTAFVPRRPGGRTRCSSSRTGKCQTSRH